MTTKTKTEAVSEAKYLMFEPAALTIATDEKHPLFDKRMLLPLKESLVQSIMAHGVLKPGRSWRDPETGVIWVADGRRRLLHLIEANKRLVKEGSAKRLFPAIPVLGDSKAAVGIMVTSNEGDESPTMLGRAESVQKMFNAGYTEEEAAVLLHVKKSELKTIQALLSCSASVRKAVANETISVTDAVKISKESPAKQKSLIKKIEKAVGGGKVKGKKASAKTGGHKKAKKIQQALGIVKMRGKKEIVAMQAKLKAASKALSVALLDWVMGGKEPPIGGGTTKRTPSAVEKEESKEKELKVEPKAEHEEVATDAAPN